MLWLKPSAGNASCIPATTVVNVAGFPVGCQARADAHFICSASKLLLGVERQEIGVVHDPVIVRARARRVAIGPALRRRAGCSN